MLDPYKMVVISVSASLLLSTTIVFYKFVYPKKNINLFVLLILISILPVISIFRTGSYESGDFTIHLYRTIEFYKSLSEGHALPAWAGGLNATYGYPLFIFNYPLPYYVISFFHLLGFSFLTSMKLFLAVCFIASGIFMYLAAKELFKNNIAAFTTAIFYQFAPYHLIDLHFKVVIGEILTFTFLPLTFFCFLKLWQNKNSLWLALTSITLALIIMSHVVLALFAMGLIFCYAFFHFYTSKKIFYLISTISAFFLASVCSAYIWLMPFFMMKYTIVKEYNFVYFPQLFELLFSPWRLGFLFQGHRGELSYLLGYTHILVIISLFVLLVWNKVSSRYKAHIVFWFIMFCVFVFLITPTSKFLWGLAPFLKITGSHRLLLITVFILSLLAGYLSLHLLRRHYLLYLLLVVTIFSTILNWGHRRVIPQITDQHLIANVWKSTSEGEGHFYANSQFRDSKNPWFSKLPKNHLEIFKGTGTVKELSRNSTTHIYIVYAKTPLQLKEHTLFFPGWVLLNNYQQVSLKPDREGIITFSLPPGLHYLELRYEDIFIYKVLKAISVAGLASLAVYCIHYFLRRNKYQ